ncbi:hypothetical protein [Solemya velesiana gill symbiont]|uniref:Uncharacterized protein n=1 Tax=Solemya velesiana gill symbiont TaxID=1918948 RepID=A0A1T2KT37_9GAMM|nr:hypothetical protein [Solemya velesiana gill symbiont]OOZ35982.1 hypothetical protein BOW51_09445 [Solemya velesiana gill symbiont]
MAETEFQPVAVGASLSQSHFLEQLALDTRGLHEKVLVESINLMVNKFEYRPEDPSQENLDHWATPYETFKNRGGDCEDLQLPSTMP